MSLRPIPLLPNATVVCSIAFVMLFGYGFVRPPIESLFLETHGSESLPAAWIAVALTAALVVAIYNHYATRIGLISLLVRAAVISAITLACFQAMHAVQAPGSVFLLYVWKDVHIVVLLEILWSFANAVYSVRTASWTYWMFCVFGSLGGMLGNLSVRGLTSVWGTPTTLWLAVPLLLVVATIGVTSKRLVQSPGPPRSEQDQPVLRDSARVLRVSPYLLSMVALIGVVQVVITFIDYQYNVALETTFTSTDERTRVLGTVYMLVDGAALALQLVTAVVLRFAGVPLTLLAIPVLLGTAVAAFAIFPRFPVVAAAKISSKALDYSLFKAAKEILYIPLTYAEKTRGKAIVDMLTYRVAKAAASVLVLIVLAFNIGASAVYITLSLIVVWWAITLRITRRYRRLVSRAQEIG